MPYQSVSGKNISNDQLKCGSGLILDIAIKSDLEDITFVGSKLIAIIKSIDLTK